MVPRRDFALKTVLLLTRGEEWSLGARSVEDVRYITAVPHSGSQPSS